jgi:hypothetical protein
MGILSKVTDFVGGSLFKEIKETVTSYFPPSMSEAEKLEFERKMQEFLHQKELDANRILNESAAQLDKRIADQEGTASDLKAMPILGPIVLFLRGLQRPAWGFLVMLMDYKWFFGVYEFDEQQQTAMIAINLLVLGFLFGERAVKNLEPLIIRVFAK